MNSALKPISEEHGNLSSIVHHTKGTPLKDWDKPKEMLVAELTHMRHQMDQMSPFSEVLSENEKARRAILDSLPDLIFRITRDGVFRSFEGATEELFRAEEEYIGKDIYHVMPKETADVIMMHIEQAFQTEDLVYYEYSMALSGHVQYYEARMMQSMDDEVLAIVRNVTRTREIELKLEEYQENLEVLVQKRTEELSRAQKKYRTIFEHSGAPAVIVENDIRISMSNPKFEQFSGYAKEEIEEKKKLLDFIAPSDRERVRSYHYARRSPGGEAPTEYECRMISRSGEVRDMIIKVGMIPGPGKSIASFIDITSLKKIENELREREALYTAILEGYEGFLYITSEDYRIRFMNENLIRQTGKNAAGQICYQAIHGREEPCPWCVIDQVFAGRSIRFEMKNPNDRRWYYSINTPIRHTDGRLSYQAMIIDIDDRKQMEEALRESEAYLRQENIRLRSTIRDRYKFGEIVGKSEPMQAVYELILNAAASDAHVIVYGESGTGKELVSRAIHDLSDRKEKRFVPVNCGAIPENLMESEFFGHQKGAFTGATANKVGYLEQADGGTLFLDEIGEISLGMQVKLLRAIEGGGFTPVGGQDVKKPNLRIIAATNRYLPDLVRKGAMREDFYYRIHIIPIHLPGLRDRKEDIPLLIDHFLKAHEGKEMPAITPRILESMMNYPWPGNVRELQNVLNRFVTLKRIDFMSPHLADEPSLPDVGQQAGPLDAGDVTGLKEAVRKFERQYLMKTLALHKGSRTRSARALSIGLRTLHRKIRELEIEN